MTRILVRMDMKKTIGAEAADSDLAKKFMSTLLDNIDSRYGSVTIQDGELEGGAWHVSVTGAWTEAQRISIQRAVHRHIEYCLAAWEG